jgi:hypothetical protein
MGDRAGVLQREIMELMRHNDSRLTAKTYHEFGEMVRDTGFEPVTPTVSR